MTVSQSDPILLAYASQTGTAQAIAEQVFTRNTTQCVLADIADIDPQELEQYRRIVFVVSTFGEGEAPVKARPFFRSLCKNSYCLKKTLFSVLALGNNQYTDFCGFGKALSQRLIQLGAEPRLPITEINRNNVAAVMHWRAKLQETFGLRTEESSDWTIATVMDVKELEHQLLEFTVYIKCLEYAHADELNIKHEQDGKQVDQITVKTSANQQDAFTRIVIPQAEASAQQRHSLLKRLSLSVPGDKWQVRISGDLHQNHKKS